MGKGDNRHGNREPKKPKKEKPRVLATANFMSGKMPVTSKAEKKPK